MEMRRLVEQRVPLTLGICAGIAAVLGAVLVVPSTSDRVLMAIAIALFTFLAAALDVFQRARYAVLPGITGLWQVARRKESSLDDMSSLDIVYCRKWTPLLDLTILYSPCRR
jgi:hypothetical protein